MRTSAILGILTVLLTVTGCLLAQGPGPRGRQPLLATSPVVDLKGTINKVQITPGRGMPSLEVEQDGETATVYLGSIRYLMQQDFNPKAGQAVEVKGYKTAQGIFAITATLPAQKKTVRLRDERGWPVWSRGGRGPRGRR